MRCNCPSVLTIAFDFDQTITAAPELMAQWMQQARQVGHRVVIVTARRDTVERYSEVNDWLIENDLESVPIFMTSGQSKLDYMDKQRQIGRVQWKVDIWIDDAPTSIVWGT